jgi:hypothetical protein
MGGCPAAKAAVATHIVPAKIRIRIVLDPLFLRIVCAWIQRKVYLKGSVAHFG